MNAISVGAGDRHILAVIVAGIRIENSSGAKVVVLRMQAQATVSNLIVPLRIGLVIPDSVVVVILLFLLSCIWNAVERYRVRLATRYGDMTNTKPQLVRGVWSPSEITRICCIMERRARQVVTCVEPSECRI